MNSERASFDEQYKALKSGASVVNLTDWASISITGKDRQLFLHNFCTNDVKRLVPGSSCEAFVTNVKGKIVGHGLIACREDELLFLGPPGQGEKLVAHLDRYVIREDVQLHDTTAERSFALVTGVGSGEPVNAGFSWLLLAREDMRIVESNAGELLNHSSESGERRPVDVGSDAFNAARIEAGMPLFGIDFNDENLPQEIGRDRQAISFTKGCYLGQETVARIDALGHVNQQIVGVHFFGSECPAAGLELTKDGGVVGRVTSKCYSLKLSAPLGLAMVRRGANAIGTRLESSAGECEVVALPV